MEAKKSLTNFSYIGIGRFVAVALQAAFFLIIASFLEPESYGELSLIVALAGSFSIISLLGLNVSLQVYVAKKNSTVYDQINSLFIITTTIAGLILLIINPIAALLCVSGSLFLMYQTYLLGLKKYKKFMINYILKSAVFLSIPLILYFVLEIPGIVLGMAISNLLFSIPYFRNLRMKSFFELKKYYKILIHNFGVSLSTTLPFLLDKLVIAPLFGLFVVGVYQFNLQIYFAFGMLPGILGAYLISEESSGVGHKKLSYLVILITIILAAVAIIIMPYFVNGFFPKYSDGILGLQVMVLAIIPLSISTPFGAKLLARESKKIGFSSIVTVGTILVFIPLLGVPYGQVGLSLAVLISNSANALFLYFLYKREKQVTA